MVHVNLYSNNVIHSFWVPELAGKTDVIPGHDNTLWMEATSYDPSNGGTTPITVSRRVRRVLRRAARPYGFCGGGADPERLAVLGGAAAGPGDQPDSGHLGGAGQAVFLSEGCTGCHVINGVTPKISTPLIGPNLTHFGSRLLIAGGVLDNNPTNLAQWIYNAQGVKPGVDMPSFNGSPGSQGNLSQDQLNNLVAYLESLN